MRQTLTCVVLAVLFALFCFCLNHWELSLIRLAFVLVVLLPLLSFFFSFGAVVADGGACGHMS